MTPGARRLSPAGGGALCVFRVERAALRAELELRDARDRVLAWPAAGRWRVGRLLQAGRLLDEVVVLGREHAIEVQGHGAPAIGQTLAAAIGASAGGDGAARASVDDPELEGAARSLRGVRALASAQDGPLAELLDGLRAGRADARTLAALERAAGLLDFGERLARPACVRLVGRPNAGKSTLFNRLAGGPRALVSPRAGTTRDTVTHELLLAGVPVRLEDAAGEHPGSPAASRSVAGADLLVHLLSEQVEEPLPGGSPCLRVRGRADLRGADPDPDALAVSGLTGLGCDALLGRVAAILGLDRPADDDLWTPVRAVDRALVRAARGR